MAVYSQTFRLEGTVMDNNDSPIIGATVALLNSDKGTITDFDGKFVLDVPQSGVLQVSYVGYKTQKNKF